MVRRFDGSKEDVPLAILSQKMALEMELIQHQYVHLTTTATLPTTPTLRTGIVDRAPQPTIATHNHHPQQLPLPC